jgi:hypothetical protein
MNETKKRYLGWTVVILAMVIAAWLGIKYPLPAAPDEVVELSVDTRFRSIYVDHSATIGEDLTVIDDLTVDAITASGYLDLGGLFKPSFADLTLSTPGQTLTPAYTVYALDTTGAISMTLAASGDEGQLLILIGDDANNITINDTNIRTSTGSALVIGQYDVVMFVYQDSEWLELLLLANS